MPFAVIEGGVFGSKVVGYGIARRKPTAHLLDAGLASFCCSICDNLGSGGCGKVHAIFIVFFIK